MGSRNPTIPPAQSPIRWCVTLYRPQIAMKHDEENIKNPRNFIGLYYNHLWLLIFHRQNILYKMGNNKQGAGFR